MKYLLPLLSLLVLLPISAIALGPHVSKVPNPHDNKIRWNRCHACLAARLRHQLAVERNNRTTIGKTHG
jgi:hypothetical protein